MKAKLAGLVCSVLVMQMNAYAAPSTIEEFVEAWRVSYSPGVINSLGAPTDQVFNPSAYSIIGTSSTCTNGALIMDGRFSFDDAKMFMTEYLAAKSSGAKMKIYYDAGTCAIVKFNIGASN